MPSPRGGRPSLRAVITALAGGVGAAKFLAGLVRAVPPESVTAIVNVADDDTFHGLHVSPDLDSVTYALAGVNNAALGWGRADESFRTIDELDRFGSDTWFRLGDLDLATHLYRTEQLRAGRPLSAVTVAIAEGFGIRTRLLPVTDDRVATRITAADPAGPAGATREFAMQEWFVRERCEPAVVAVHFDGADAARPAPGVLEALHTAETIVLCPSNPVISIGPLLAVRGIRDILAARRDHVVAISPIVGGAPVKGPADRLMGPLGIEVSCVGVAREYAALCGTLVVDAVDRHRAGEVESAGLRCIVADTMMHSPEIAAALARTTLAAVA